MSLIQALNPDTKYVRYSNPLAPGGITLDPNFAPMERWQGNLTAPTRDSSGKMVSDFISQQEIGHKSWRDTFEEAVKLGLNPNFYFTKAGYDKLGDYGTVLNDFGGKTWGQALEESRAAGRLTADALGMLESAEARKNRSSGFLNKFGFALPALMGAGFLALPAAAGTAGVAGASAAGNAIPALHAASVGGSTVAGSGIGALSSTGLLGTIGGYAPAITTTGATLGTGVINNSGSFLSRLSNLDFTDLPSSNPFSSSQPSTEQRPNYNFQTPPFNPVTIDGGNPLYSPTNRNRRPVYNYSPSKYYGLLNYRGLS